MRNDRKIKIIKGMKIWHALVKYIAMQVDKDFIVDSLYFGTFTK